ncbi:MAG: Signal peptidase complex catalytic subunit S11A, partial [Paramarteilia canceri]
MLDFGLALAMAHFIWLTIMLLLDNEGPLVVVISGSMEPHFFRGDVMVTTNRDRNFNIGDIVAFRISNRDIPIVHRILDIYH